MELIKHVIHIQIFVLLALNQYPIVGQCLIVPNDHLCEQILQIPSAIKLNKHRASIYLRQPLTIQVDLHVVSFTPFIIF